VGLSLLIVTALWVSNRGLQHVLDGGRDALSALGRLTGLLASDLLLQVLLMARGPAGGAGVRFRNGGVRCVVADRTYRGGRGHRHRLDDSDRDVGRHEPR
jgi:hypothetical protein